MTSNTTVTPTRVTATLSQVGDTITLELPDWPGGALSISHTPETGTTLHTRSFTHVVDGDYTLIVNGSHTTIVRKHSLMRTLGHAITFASRTIQLNPLGDRLARYILKQEQRATQILSRLFPRFDTAATIADKRAKLLSDGTPQHTDTPSCSCHDCTKDAE